MGNHSTPGQREWWREEYVASDPVRYGEPSWLDVYPEPADNKSSIDRWLANGYRVRRIAVGIAELEILQPGVLRYPPVYVEVERRPEAVQEYLDRAYSPSLHA